MTATASKTVSDGVLRAPQTPDTRITCSRADLVEALTTAATVAPAKSPRKILEDVRIVAKPGARLECFATDGDTSARLAVAAADISGFDTLDVCVNAKRTLALVRAITDEKIAITPRDMGMLRIASAANSKTKFDVCTSIDTGDFPDMAFLGAKLAGKPVLVDGPALATALARTAFAASQEATRYTLHGVAFDWSTAGALTLVGTDGKVIAIARVEGGAPGSPGYVEGDVSGAVAVISNRSIVALRRFIEGAVKVTIWRDEFRMVFGLGDGTSGEVLSAQLLSGHFPPYMNAVPAPGAEGSLAVDLDRAALVEAVNAAALVTTTDSKAVRLSFAAGKGTLTVSARGPDAGESAIEIPCAWAHEDFEICLDPRYLLPALGAVDLDVIPLEMSTPARPVVMRLEDGSYVYVVMPITF